MNQSIKIKKLGLEDQREEEKNLKQSGSVADVVSDSTLGSDTDLVDVDGHRGLRLLDPLELVHGFWVLDLGERRCCW